MLTREKKRLHQRSFAANGHAGKSFEPLALGDIGLGVEPLRQQLKLRRRNLAALDAIEQMLKKGRRDVLTADLRHVGF